MTQGVTTPDLPEFRQLASSHRVIPVRRKLLADGETALGLYTKLARHRPGTFLYESAEHGGVWGRYSFVGVSSAATLTERDGSAIWEGTPPVGLPSGGDPLQVIRDTLQRLHTPRLPGLPPLTGGLVGYIGYDAVRRLERLPDLTEDDLGIPELGLMFATDVAVLDHRDRTVLLIANAVNWDDSDERVDEAWKDAVRRLDVMVGDLTGPTPSTVAVADLDRVLEYRRRRTAEEHQEAVLAAKREIHRGEAFQVVVSQRFERETTADPFDVYRVLRIANPSPYLYLLRFGDFDVVGSSPEALVTVSGDHVLTHPIAGTRPRGATPEQDHELEQDLLADVKERAEHLMLVDLGRNDLGRVCRPGSVSVVDFMTIRRYSHVMHLESTVVGSLAEGRTAFDALCACFPAGTLSGAPKPRAMQIIEQLEPTRRGLYGGVVGYLGFCGDLDAAIAIRTALLRDGVAYVQAGGGIVADSDPEAEDAETRSKAASALRAIAAAESFEQP